MDKNAIELWATEALEHENLAHADSPQLRRVRLFPKLPAPAGAARTLAGQANAAQGRDLLWLMGVDPSAQAQNNGGSRKKTETPSRREYESWRDEVMRHFEGIGPTLEELPLETDDHGRVMAVFIETERAPFVVYRSNKQRKDGSRPTDVLWEDKNALRTARRLDLVKLVAPLRDLPSLEVISADLNLYENVNRRLEPGVAYHWSLDATLYIVPQKAERLVLPYRKCRMFFEAADGSFRSEAKQVNLSSSKESSAIQSTDEALMVNGVGQFYFFASGSTGEEDFRLGAGLRVTVSATPAGFTQAAIASGEMVRTPGQDVDSHAGQFRLA